MQQRLRLKWRKIRTALNTTDYILLLDLSPEPGFPHVYPESIQRASLPADVGTEFKLTKELRLRVITLPIYSDKHHYHIIAKIEAGSNSFERQRAARAVNEFLDDKLKAGFRLDEAIERIVDAFPPRVLNRLQYLPKVDTMPALPCRRTRNRPIISSDDIDPIIPKPPPPSKKRPARDVDVTPKAKASKADVTLGPADSPDRPATPEPAQVHMSSGLTPIFYTRTDDLDPAADIGPIETSPLNSDPMATVGAASNAQPEVDANLPTDANPPSGLGERTASQKIQPKDNSGGTSPLPTIRRNLPDAKFQKIMEKLDAVQTKEDTRYDFTAATIKHMSKTIDRLRDVLGDVKNSIQILTAATVQRQVLDTALFPCETEADVESVANDKNKLEALIARYLL